MWSLSTILEGPEIDSVYVLRVRGYNKAGYGEYSEDIYLHTPPAPGKCSPLRRGPYMCVTGGGSSGRGPQVVSSVVSLHLRATRGRRVIEQTVQVKVWRETTQEREDVSGRR